MKILIVGGSGLVGGNMLNYFAKETTWEITATYNAFEVDGLIQFNASDESTWSDEVRSTKWDVIIHTGALTHVDKCEEEVELSRLQTVQSTMNLVTLAKANAAKFIYISTDYVFDGESGPYTERAETNPLSVYGKHKLQSETIIADTLEDYLILRVTNVYGDETRGKNFVSRIIDQIREGKNNQASGPSDQYATPVNAYDIARVSLLLINDDKKGIYHVSSTDYLNRIQFLNRLNNFFSGALVIQPKSTKELNQVANRPLLGGLIAERFLAEYPNFYFSNIDDYLIKYNDRF